LSNYLSVIPNAFITGFDINEHELRQAKRVFEQPGKIEFINEVPLGRKFDQVIFAASIQYFISLTQTINEYFDLLNPGGEIHILDTHFYSEKELVPARERSAEYFNQQGFPGFSSHYFHHRLEDLARYDFQILYQPSIINRFLKNYKNPFYWICIRNKTG
jgi:ubiquinone/menaquinone biosynthesis C-methylase UbiE